MFITPSHLLEYLYCPRFTYYEYVLGIDRREEKRLKVQLGKDTHLFKEKINPGYLRKKLGAVKKEQEVELVSPSLNLKGKVDELLYLEDGTMSPFDYKFAEYKDRIWKTFKIQETLYALMIKQLYQVEVKKAFLCFIRSKSKIVEIEFTEKDFEEAVDAVNECLSIIQDGYYPQATRVKARCPDCTYRNLCIG
ncbi:MAG: CRISPR-associated protein Cas4 [Victivallales bacterium]|nr:CRISPR-associated protein Cas4 [Victivallales bacterium]MCF7888740.1 CRISPR-associated protein Cas4 [Victivallales bacterium]